MSTKVEMNPTMLYNQSIIDTYVVTLLQPCFHIFVHVMMIQCHEHCVDHNAQRNEQLGERIEHQPGDALLEFQPRPAAVPNAKDVDAAAERFDGLVAERRTVFVVLLCGKIVHGN